MVGSGGSCESSIEKEVPMFVIGMHNAGDERAAEFDELEHLAFQGDKFEKIGEASFIERDCFAIRASKCERKIRGV